mmetsp:Transcript_14967/g.21814  ORF Transcript_14967/g.21814 Transcript_14967/m.21814 type:complete len:182 (-) Transcript_14967:302-847(-)
MPVSTGWRSCRSIVDTRARVTGIACARECVNRARVAKQERVSQKELVRERQSSETGVCIFVCVGETFLTQNQDREHKAVVSRRALNTLGNTATHCNTLQYTRARVGGRGARPCPATDCNTPGERSATHTHTNNKTLTYTPIALSHTHAQSQAHTASLRSTRVSKVHMALTPNVNTHLVCTT